MKGRVNKKLYEFCHFHSPEECLNVPEHTENIYKLLQQCDVSMRMHWSELTCT